MKLDVEALKRQDPAAMKELMAVCRECARIGASKVGAGPFADDIAQDMVMFVLDRWLAVYDGERDVEPYLIEVARRTGLGYYRRHSREPTVSAQADGHNLVDMLEDSAELAEALLVEDEQARLADEAKAALIQRMRDFKQSRPKAPSMPSPPGRKPKRRYTSKEQAARDFHHQERQIRADKPEIRELVAIRKRMGLTQEEMARALELSSPNAIRSIEYGVVVGAPEELVIRAREIEAKHGGIDARGPAVELLRRWSLKLKIDPDDSIELARQLGIHRSTVFRWKTGRSRPMPHAVRLLDAVVEALSSD